jgi:hypothetical protein
VTELDIYDIAGDRWKKGARMPTAREHLASCAVSGKLIAVGGWKDRERVAQAAVESYDPTTDRWTALPPLPTPRGGLAAVAVGSACHVLGGEDWALPGTFDTHETFDGMSRAGAASLRRGALTCPALRCARSTIGGLRCGLRDFGYSDCDSTRSRRIVPMRRWSSMMLAEAFGVGCTWNGR